MSGWLILEIALGVAFGQLIWAGLKAFATNRERGPDFKPDAELENDWEFLWNNVPESAKEDIRVAAADDKLFRRAQALNLWPHLWHAAPESVKEQLRERWKAQKIPPRWKS